MGAEPEVLKGANIVPRTLSSSGTNTKVQGKVAPVGRKEITSLEGKGRKPSYPFTAVEAKARAKAIRKWVQIYAGNQSM